MLLSRGAEIFVTISTSGELCLPDPPSCYRSIHHAYHPLYFNRSHLETTFVVLTFVARDHCMWLKVSSSIHTVGRSTFVNVRTSFK